MGLGWNDSIGKGSMYDRVCVIGLGYVGLPLCVEFARGGLHVTGIDVDIAKVKAIHEKTSYIADVDSEVLAGLVTEGRLEATTDYAVLRDADAVCICVPTPLRKSMDPDISYIVAAVDAVAEHLHPGMLIVLESTTYPGTTEELVLPKLEESGLTAGKDFYLAFSPERVDPSNAQYKTRNTPKVIGGITPACTERAAELYRHAVDTVVPVSSAGVAEMVKLLENTYRAVNIGLVNELAIMCDRLDIDVWEVIDAASTKPFGFMPFYPGPGLGGHCIPVDPLYLSWKLKTIKYTARFIELASTINSSMPEYVVEKVALALNDECKSIRGSRILVMGVAYKRDVDDVRESPALDILGLLLQRGAELSYTDPHVASVELPGRVLHSVDAAEGLGAFDCVVIVTDHTAFDYDALASEAALIVDTRNAMARCTRPVSGRIVRL